MIKNANGPTNIYRNMHIKKFDSEVNMIWKWLNVHVLAGASADLYGVRMLRGGGLSERWYTSITGFGMEFLDTTCWSWIVELLNAFRMLMSCKDTEEQADRPIKHHQTPALVYYWDIRDVNTKLTLFLFKWAVFGQFWQHQWIRLYPVVVYS